MKVVEKERLTKQQERLLKLVYKFRFVTAPLVAQALGFSRYSVYQVLELLKDKEFLVKVYDKSWKIDRKPARYFLSKKGVTTVRKLLDLPASAVNTIYQDNRATEEFILECLNTLTCYTVLKKLYPKASIRAKTEINRFAVFPKHRPNLYIKTEDNKEAFVLILPDKLPYFVHKRLDEYVEHSEDEGWLDTYPTVAFVLKNERQKYGFLYKAKQKLDNLGFEEEDLTILATSLDALRSAKGGVWSSAFSPSRTVELF